MKYLILVLLLLGCANHKGTSPGRALVIGDSISIGYTPHLSDLFIQNNVSLEHAKDTDGTIQNSRDTSTGLANIDRWLLQNGDAKWDLVTFNHGIHDIKFYDISVDEYINNLRVIATKIQEKSETCVYLTTTEIHETDPVIVAKVLEYNLAATQLMGELGIPVIDLFTTSQWLRPYRTDGVHYDDYGSDYLAQTIFNFID